jgi:hypothetical protein
MASVIIHHVHSQGMFHCFHGPICLDMDLTGVGVMGRQSDGLGMTPFDFWFVTSDSRPDCIFTTQKKQITNSLLD